MTVSPELLTVPDAAAQPAPIALTPRAEARVAARRFARAVAALDEPNDRLDAMLLAMSEAVRLLDLAEQTA